MSKTNAQLKQLILAALFAALTCAATLSIRIPTPGTSGYIHPGDALVILSGIFLGPFYGFLAAGIGSALADFLGGYFIYLPFTLLIKGFVALLTAFLAETFRKRELPLYPAVLLGGLIDIALVVGGYFLLESLLYGPAAAALSAPANLLQGSGGLIISALLYPLLAKTALFR